MTFPEIMTAEQVAFLLQVEEKTIRNWTSLGKIPCRHIGGTVRYMKSEIDEFMKKQPRSIKRRKKK